MPVQTALEIRLDPPTTERVPATDRCTNHRRLQTEAGFSPSLVPQEMGQLAERTVQVLKSGSLRCLMQSAKHTCALKKQTDPQAQTCLSLSSCVALWQPVMHTSLLLCQEMVFLLSFNGHRNNVHRLQLISS